MVQPEKIAMSNAASYIDWWKTAGIDYQVDAQPYNWLQDSEPGADTPVRIPVTKLLPIKNKKPLSWPQDLRQLISDISNADGLPGTGYGGKTASPKGNVEAKLMIVGDLPDTEDINTGILGEGPSGKLLRQMIAAMGVDYDNCYYVTLACSRPATSDIPYADMSGLADFVVYQMKLLRPQFVLILGSIACQALLNAELMTARGNLHYFNHDGQKVASLVTFHPRTLLSRPILKAQAWKDLQMINIKDAL